MVAMSNQNVVLITGASSGIGRSSATLLAAKGYAVYGTTRNPGAFQSIPDVDVLVLDVTSDASVRACVDAVMARRGRLDVLVNNAGYVLTGAIEEASIDDAKAQFETNFFGMLRMVKAALPIMRQQRTGTIVNISSLSGVVPGPPFCGIYSASKFALEAYSENLRREVKPFNVRVALVEPGSINTSLTSNRREAAQRSSAYDSRRQRAVDALRSREARAPDAMRVARTVLAIIESRSPKLRYRVGVDAIVVPRLRQFLPESLFEKALAKTFNLDGE